MSNRTLHHRLQGGRWNQARAYVLERDGGICWLCGGDDADAADHYPIHLKDMSEEDWDNGLPWDTNNLRAAHKICNSRRGTKHEARQQWFNPRWLDSL